MRGLVKHEKRNMLIITLVFTIVVWFVLQGVIANDIAGNGNQINNFDGYIYNNYGNLFLGTLNQYYELFIMILMIPISFVAIMQYRESSISKCGEFLMQLPVKRGQIFLVRTIIGMMIYTIPWLFFSFGMVMMRIQAESWYEMKLSSCTNGELLLGNDNVFHLCVYLLFMWISLTLIYAVAVFFQFEPLPEEQILAEEVIAHLSIEFLPIPCKSLRFPQANIRVGPFCPHAAAEAAALGQ